MATTNLGKVGFSVKGAYSTTTAYKNLDVVSYNGDLYCARTDVPAGTAVTDTTKWLKMIDNSDKLNKNQGSANAGKILAVGTDGNIVYTQGTDPVTDKTLSVQNKAADGKAVGTALNDKLPKNQGTANAGKILAVGTDGNIVYKDGADPETDKTLSVENKAADGKAVGTALDKKVNIAQGAANAKKILSVGTDGNVALVGTDKTMLVQDVPADAKTVGNKLNEKVDVDQGVANAKKLLGVGTDGNVALVSVDKTMLVEDAPADAKTVGDKLGEKVDVDQGTANAKKVLAVGDDGNVALVEIDKTMLVEDVPADAKTVGEKLDEKLDIDQGDTNANKLLYVNTDGEVTLFSAFVTPEMFGAAGDGTTDDTVAIQNAIDSASTFGGTVLLTSPSYKIKHQTEGDVDTPILIAKSNVTILSPAHSKIITNDAAKYNCMIGFKPETDDTIEYFTIDGVVFDQTDDKAITDTTYTNMVIYINNGKCIAIRNCTLITFGTNSIVVRGLQIFIESNEIDVIHPDITPKSTTCIFATGLKIRILNNIVINDKTNTTHSCEGISITGYGNVSGNSVYNTKSGIIISNAVSKGTLFYWSSNYAVEEQCTINNNRIDNCTMSISLVNSASSTTIEYPIMKNVMVSNNICVDVGRAIVNSGTGDIDNVSFVNNYYKCKGPMNYVTTSDAVTHYVAADLTKNCVIKNMTIENNIFDYYAVMLRHGGASITAAQDIQIKNNTFRHIECKSEIDLRSSANISKLFLFIVNNTNAYVKIIGNTISFDSGMDISTGILFVTKGKALFDKNNHITDADYLPVVNSKQIVFTESVAGGIDFDGADVRSIQISDGTKWYNAGDKRLNTTSHSYITLEECTSSGRGTEKTATLPDGKMCITPFGFYFTSTEYDSIDVGDWITIWTDTVTTKYAHQVLLKFDGRFYTDRMRESALRNGFTVGQEVDAHMEFIQAKFTPVMTDEIAALQARVTALQNA